MRPCRVNPSPPPRCCRAAGPRPAPNVTPTAMLLSPSSEHAGGAVRRPPCPALPSSLPFGPGTPLPSPLTPAPSRRAGKAGQAAPGGSRHPPRALTARPRVPGARLSASEPGPGPSPQARPSKFYLRSDPPWRDAGPGGASRSWEAGSRSRVQFPAPGRVEAGGGRAGWAETARDSGQRARPGGAPRSAKPGKDAWRTSAASSDAWIEFFSYSCSFFFFGPLFPTSELFPLPDSPPRLLIFVPFLLL